MMDIHGGCFESFQMFFSMKKFKTASYTFETKVGRNIVDSKQSKL